MNIRLKYMIYTMIIATVCIFASSASSAELQLAGIKLGRHASTILKIYGNPTEIRVGNVTTAVSTDTPGAAMPGMAPMGGGAALPGMPPLAGGALPGMPPVTGGMTGAMPGLAPMTGGALPGMPPVTGGMTGAMPGLAPMTGAMPGMAPMTDGMPGMTAPGGTSASVSTATEVTWIYRFSNNRTLECVINPQGKIIQVSGFGGSWPGLSTAKGLKVGNSYKDVIRIYGWPKSHEIQGNSLIVKYPDTHRILFTMIDQRVVGITIALMD